MDKSARIFVAGHRGLVGSAIDKALLEQGYTHILTATHQDVDLSQFEPTKYFFQKHQPEYVFLAAAKVGGIHANHQYPVDFLLNNLNIQNNVIRCASDYNVKRLIFLGSSCIYPRECPQPIQESYLLSGPLESTNKPYALAKISGIELCDAYYRQYQKQFLSVMPTNLYGPQDNYDLEKSHVIPALIRKMHEAKVQGKTTVEIWGTGQPRREFLYSDDLANACIHIANLSDLKFDSLLQKSPPIINIGWGRDISIKELVGLVAEVVGYRGNFEFNSKYLDGTPQKVLNIDRIIETGWAPKISLREGLALAYKSFVESLQKKEELASC